MRESRTYGFVRGVLGNRHPYRDSQPFVRNVPEWRVDLGKYRKRCLPTVACADRVSCLCFS
jgi:hypothetical protein